MMAGQKTSRAGSRSSASLSSGSRASRRSVSRWIPRKARDVVEASVFSSATGMPRYVFSKSACGEHSFPSYCFFSVCHDAGLPETGRKAALVARLSNANHPSTRGTVNQETPPGQHHGAESDPRSLQTERTNEPSNASSIAAFNLTARRRHSTRSGPRHTTHPASAPLRARRLLRKHRRQVGAHHRPSLHRRLQHSRQARMHGHQLTLGDQQRLPSLTANPVLSLPCLLAYEIVSCEVSLLTSQNSCPRLCVTNTSSAPLHYPLAMDKAQTPSNLR